MFAVIYRAYVKVECEKDFQQLWRQIAEYFVENCGALGSCLHKTEDGMWLAYSRWPDKATRDSFWPSENTLPEKLPEEIKTAIDRIKKCFNHDRELPEICMTVVDDLL